MSATVTARRVTDYDELSAPGDFAYYTAYGGSDTEYVGMIFICPCGCGCKSSLNFRPPDKPRWNWNGDIKSPTLSPSVLKTSDCKWHGLLTNGVWREC